MDRLPDLSSLSHAEKDALIHALWAQVQALTARVAELEAKLDLPPKTPDNSSLPPSRGKKPNREAQPARTGPRQGSLGRQGGGRRLAEAPDETVAILARLRRARVVCSDETGVRIDGRNAWNWVFQNGEVVIHVVRHSRGAGVVAEVMAGHRPAVWVSDLYSAQRGHAEAWQICLAHQLRDCRYAIEAGDTIFAPRMKALLLRAAVLARRHRGLAESTRREYRRRLEQALDAVMALAPTHRHGQRLRRRYGTLREHLFTFLDHPEVTADNNGSERELRPTANYRKVTGGFRSDWGADLYAAVRSDLYAAVRSVIGTAARRGIDAYQAIRTTLHGQSVLAPS